MKANLLAVLGGIAGGVLGFIVCVWTYEQGFYALALPGCLVGFGAGYFRPRSILVAIASGIGATALGLLVDHHVAPFRDDRSLTFYLSNLSHLAPVVKLMIAVGGFVGFWVPFRQRAADTYRAIDG
ncbi:MAG: hypothetical protein U0746_06265 [Gemmataceae bacterium]